MHLMGVVIVPPVEWTAEEHTQVDSAADELWEANSEWWEKFFAAGGKN